MQTYLAFQADLNHPETVSVYDELPLWSAMFGLLLLKHVPMRPNLTVLDVGFGTGFPLLELAQRLGSTCKVYGIDPWEEARQRANLKAQVWQVRNVEMHRGDAAAMPFPDGLFDMIVSNLGVNNFSDPETVLKECWRVTKPSARVVLTTNLQGHMHEFYGVFESALDDLGQQEALKALRRHIEQRATLDGLADLFSRTGFRMSTIHEESAPMRFMDGSALLRHYFIRLGFLESWKAIPSPNQQREVFSRLEERLNHWAESRGELNLTIPMAYVEAERVPQSNCKGG